MDMMKKALYLGLGIFSVSREKAEKLVNDLIEKGEVNREEAGQVIEDLIKKGEEEKEAIRNLVKDEVGGFKKDFSMVSRTELDQLKTRLEELEKKLSDFNKNI